MADRYASGPADAARLLRVLHMVRQCDRALIRARTAQDAVQSVCNALIEVAEVDLAWIGCCENNFAGTIRPVAHAGPGAERLARYRAPDAGHGRDPVAEAMRSRTYCLIQDARCDSRHDRPAGAASLDYRSSIALPLIAEGPGSGQFVSRGVLALYSAKDNAFDAITVDALVDVAANIARALERMGGDAPSDMSTTSGDRGAPDGAIGNQDQLRAVIDTIPAAAWIALPNGSSALVNQRWLDYTGLDIANSAGQGWQSVFHPADIDRHLEKWCASLADGRSFENEARLRRAADGSYRWFLIRAEPARDRSGHVALWYGIAIDIEDIKRAEQSLQRSRTYLADAQRMSRTGSWAFDVAARCVIHSSEEHNRMFGFASTNDLPAWDEWVERIHPEDRERVMQTIATKIQEGADFEFDCRIVHPDGAVKYVHTLGHPIFDSDGTVVEFAGTTIDVTERVQAEDALRESEERWRAAFENNPTMYFIVDATGTILSVNRFGAAQLGYTADDLAGESISAVFNESDHGAIHENIATCLEELGRATSQELRMLGRQRSTLWVRVTARAMLMRDRPVVLVACEDITGRKRAELLTEQVFERTPDGICVVGRDFRYRRSNPVYARRWGTPAERIVGMHVAELLGSDAFDRVLKPNLDRCFAGEEVLFEWFSEFRGGHYLSVSYSPLRSGADEVDAALVVQRDLTAYMRASEALREAQSELAHVNRVATMGQLTASIAHEVNQPLTATITAAEAALRWLETDPPDLMEVRQALESIVISGNRAGQVVDRIRALVKKAPPRKDRLDLNEAIREVIALIRSEASKFGVIVQTNLAEVLPLIDGDRVQLQQVVLNLIINAFEAMSGRDEQPREVLISTARSPTGGALVSVQDTGPGLPAGAIDRLFDAFYTTKPSGMGIGLSVCRSIIEAHGGHVSAASNSSRGAIFRFEVPASAPGT